MNKILMNIYLLMALMVLGSCDNFFITDPDDVINEEDYIGAQSEMYSGYLGILTKLQEVGDQAIFLTDTRANFLEPTRNTPLELIDVYNYADLQGNSYADPVGYYALIIACNDYLQKMRDYKAEVGDAMDEMTEKHYKALISSTIRVKVWTYLKMGQIYGEAVYFDDPLTSMTDLSKFPKQDLTTLLNTCITLLDNGIDGIDGSLEMNWAEWLNPSDVSDASVVWWKYLTPDWLALRCELCLWLGRDYEWVKDQILDLLAETFQGDGYKWRLNAGWSSNYYRIFAENQYYSRSEVSCIIYNYKQHQTNRLITYFGARYPALYYLKPSEYGISLYVDGDRRGNGTNYTSQDGEMVMTKYHNNYRYRQPYQSDATIKIYRAHDYHFFLAEAENMLGHWEECRTILNEGIEGRFTDGTQESVVAGGFDERYKYWQKPKNGYGNIGICGVVGAVQHELPTPEDEDYALTEAQRQRIYDEALLDEMLLEYQGEGRAYGMMIRMARKYNDPTMISSRVTPKYPEAMQGEVKSKIESGGYFVKWDLTK